MKYTYAYKTSDGIRHEATMDATSREAVFAKLREQGIKAIKVVAADGSRANGEIRGIRRRIVVGITLSVAVAVGGIAFLIGKGERPDGSTGTIVNAPHMSTRVRAAQPLIRQAIAGDRSRLETATLSLTNAADRLLAEFAEPGRPLRNGRPRPSDADFRAALAETLWIADNELTESIDLKRIVVGIKKEMREYLVGGGTPSQFIDECIKRQKHEISFRERAENRLTELLKGHSEPAYDYWLKSNAQLQSMGIYPLPLPDKLRIYQLSLDIEEE